MRAVPVEETVSAGLIAVENEILAQQAHGFRRLVIQLGHGDDGHPVAPKQLSHRRASADLRQLPVLFVAQHRFGSSISVVEGGLSRTLRDYLRSTLRRSILLSVSASFMQHSLLTRSNLNLVPPYPAAEKISSVV